MNPMFYLTTCHVIPSDGRNGRGCLITLCRVTHTSKVSLTLAIDEEVGEEGVGTGHRGHTHCRVEELHDERWFSGQR